MNTEGNELKETPADQPLSAWEAAARAGVDMSLIEFALSQSPECRIRRNSDFVKFAQKLKSAMLRRDEAN